MYSTDLCQCYPLTSNCIFITIVFGCYSCMKRWTSYVLSRSCYRIAETLGSWTAIHCQKQWHKAVHVSNTFVAIAGWSPPLWLQTSWHARQRTLNMRLQWPNSSCPRMDPCSRCAVDTTLCLTIPMDASSQSLEACCVLDKFDNCVRSVQCLCQVQANTGSSVPVLFFMRTMPGWHSWSSSSKHVHSWPGTGMMTRVPHKIQPCCSESSSRRLWNTANSSAVFDGQPCRT